MDSLNSPTNGIHLPNNRYRNDTQVQRILMEKNLLWNIHSHSAPKTWIFVLKKKRKIPISFQSISSNFENRNRFKPCLIYVWTIDLIWFDYLTDEWMFNLLKNLKEFKFEAISCYLFFLLIFFRFVIGKERKWKYPI